jgi:hypothetical protein
VRARLTESRFFVRYAYSSTLGRRPQVRESHLEVYAYSASLATSGAEAWAAREKVEGFRIIEVKAAAS